MTTNLASSLAVLSEPASMPDTALHADVEVVRDRRALGAWREAWTELLRASDADRVFLTWEWLRTWWHQVAASRDPRTLVVRDGGRIVGLAPLARRPASAATFGSDRIEFAGTGAVGSDYLDCIARRGAEDVVARAIAGWLAATGLPVRFAQISPGTALVDRVAARLVERGWRRLDARTETCPVIDLAGHTWDSYLGTLGSSHRANVRRRLRQLEASFSVSFGAVDTDVARREALDDLFALHQARWEPRGGSDGLHTEALRRFHHHFTALARPRGWLRLFVLRLDGRPAAAVYGLRYGPTFSFYQSGFDPALARHSVGLVALGLSIREAIAEGATEYDLLHGREPYKFLWARRTRDLGRIDLFPPTLGGRWRWHAASLRGGVARRTARVRAALEAARP